MHGEGFFFQAFVYLLAAVVSVPIAKRLGLGSVLGYLLAGIAIGPCGLGLVGEEGADVLHFAEFGVVMMLFLIGLELQPALLWRMRGPILGLGGLQVAVTAAVLTAAAIVLGLPWNAGAGGRPDPRAVVDRHRAADPRREGAAEDRRRAECIRGAALPGHRRHPDAGRCCRCSPAGGGPARPAPEQASWISGLPAWAQTLAVLAAVVAVVVGGPLPDATRVPLHRPRRGCGSCSRRRRCCW